MGGTCMATCIVEVIIIRGGMTAAYVTLPLCGVEKAVICTGWVWGGGGEGT